MNEYIEREAVLKWVESWLNMDRYYDPAGKYNMIPIAELHAMLKQIPAADVAQIRHGRWRLAIEGRNRFTCSVCGWSKRTASHVSLGYLEYNYCPNCGAKMDGGERHDLSAQ